LGKQPLKFVRLQFFRQQDLNGGNANYCCRSTPWYPMAGQAEVLPDVARMRPDLGPKAEF